MFEIDSVNQNENSQRKIFKRPRNFFVTLIVFIFLGCAIFYCLIIPTTTGQSCFDPLSSHIPYKAEEMFLEILVNGMAEHDYDLLAKISTPNGLAQLRQLEITTTRNYEITMSDNLLGVYEKEILFDNGILVHITYGGNWTCPDFFVTEQEVFEEINLLKIRLVEQ